ncbi:hypothetical protein K0M31_002751 [Melipona bicolor]|uniref:Uncharacterized protein n=1 Tax=Melipona bicolor TaxID=60889 RepID=A0AA40KPT7_9HYME|nr:hypothetical protein K0M31_002751 [Melipona bicolor]
MLNKFISKILFTYLQINRKFPDHYFSDREPEGIGKFARLPREIEETDLLRRPDYQINSPVSPRNSPANYSASGFRKQKSNSSIKHRKRACGAKPSAKLFERSNPIRRPVGEFYARRSSCQLVGTPNFLAWE